MAIYDAVVDYALAQVGKDYLFGAAGPNAFDCSGLTMRAWEHAGIELPHNALAQATVTARLDSFHLSLQPGDLFFYYLPISHVSICVGRNKLGRPLVVQASAPGLGVEKLTATQYVGWRIRGRVKYPGWQN